MSEIEDKNVESKPGDSSTGKETVGSRASVVASVVPLHSVTGPIKRGRGRPRKINPPPTVDDLAYHAEMARIREEFISEDPVVKSTSQRKEALEVLHNIKLQIAQEAAALNFARIEAEKYGKDAAQTSSRRITALREVANIELEIRKLGVQMLDVRSERVQKLVGYLIEVVQEAALKVLDPKEFDLFVSQLGASLEGWEERAEHIIT